MAHGGSALRISAHFHPRITCFDGEVIGCPIGLDKSWEERLFRPPQIAQQDVSSLAAQREIERVVGLNLDDPQSLMSPIQIVQFQTNQFRTAQSISRRQVKESPVTPSLSIG